MHKLLVPLPTVNACGALRLFRNSAVNNCALKTFCRHNSNRTAVTRMHRSRYAKMYPTLLVFPDGSTLNIRYHEPRAIIKLPVDLSTLSEEERAARLEKRKPKTKIVVEEKLESSFDFNKYSHLWKKK